MLEKARNADYTKEYNRKAVMRILRENPMSRSELARVTGLTRATTSLIVEELLNDGYLTEQPPISVGRGRSAIPVAIRENGCYALGVHLTRRGCTVGLCDMLGNIQGYQQIDTRDELMNPIIKTLESILRSVDRSRVVGIGVDSPGPLDRVGGRILNPPRFERWHGIEITKILSSALNIPAYLEHDACALAIHQQKIGQSDNFLLLLVNSGIGAGIVLHGKSLDLTNHFTGELGHTSIHFNGRLCDCGNRGCLETYASIPNLLSGTPFSGWTELVEAAAVNPQAAELLEKEAGYLSAGIINMINLIPVDTLYLAGDLYHGVDLLAPRLQRHLGTKALNRSAANLRILPADQREEVGVLAAADVVFSHFLTV